MHIFARALALIFVVSGLGVICAPKALAADEPIIVVVRLFPAEGREDEARARLAKLVKFVPANNPGVTFRLHQSTKKPIVFLSEAGFWAPFFTLMQHTVDANLTPAA